MENFKVLLLNGSPHKTGCTFTALEEIKVVLADQGIDSDIINIAGRPLSGCMGCNACVKLGRCVIDDQVNEVADVAEEYSGFIFGSPVHYASASGFITSFLDRLFYSAGDKLAYKPGAAIVSCRRAGSTAALDQLNKYFTINNMPVVSSCYWNMVHGASASEVPHDEEGMQVMRTLARNMAWLVKCIAHGTTAGIHAPEPEARRMRTNFIR